MTSEEYRDLIAPDEFDNAPIVREVDTRRQQDLRRTLALVVAFVAVALVAAWQHVELLQQGYRNERLHQARARAVETNRHLRLELETLRSLARIERVATGQLALVPPRAGEAIVIERVLTSPAPDPSVAARRQPRRQAQPRPLTQSRPLEQPRPQVRQGPAPHGE